MVFFLFFIINYAIVHKKKNDVDFPSFYFFFRLPI